MSEPIEPARFAAASTGILSLAALMALFGVPALRFANPISLLLLAFALSAFILLVLAGQVNKSAVVSIGGAIGGMIVLILLGGSIADSAGTAAIANDARCEAIQNDMLAAQPRRSDGPDLFQALGCRPQGEGSVFTRPTRLERRANHKLPNGGRS